MARYIKVDDYKDIESDYLIHGEYGQETRYMQMMDDVIANKSIDIVRCSECKKSHIDGKTTHYLWCTEWGRSTDTFGYCERGEREGE